ncbi:MAG: M1 family metallopeptidase, partial [Candidatus Krumholzibacteria bacterium]|nr:M1 family metallopeptidase [Candidatus Krumholzibacteria bacterium]
MRRLLCLAIAASLHLAAVVAHGEEGYFQQYAHYTLRVRLDTKQHTLEGTETILYRNNSPDTLDVFYLHLYPNAFTSKNTPLIKDYSRRFNYSFIDLRKKYRSNLVLSNVSIDGTSVTPEVEHTLAKIDLPAPLAPGDSMVVSLEFNEKIRRHLGRAGYRGKQYDLAQWYPKVAVYDEKGFHADQMRTGEFYGEFGTFDVHLEVPEHYVVAATGVPKQGDPGWSLNPVDAKGAARRPKGEVPYKTVHFHAENVHDFAWNASPNFAVQDTTWNDVQIKSFFNRGNKKWRDSTLTHGLRAVEWLSERVGPYPYPQVSIVEALLSGGMEYPMLVMDGQVSEALVF